jgi:uncharacterized protein with FMN-binding domain
MKKTFTALLIGFMILIIIGSAVYFQTIRDYKLYINALTINTLQLDTIPDGTYIGDADSGVVRATVRVTMKDHQIQHIEILRHDNGKGKAAESIINSVIDAQNLQVDTVSGATGSSKIILKAIENALEDSVEDSVK